MDQRDGIKKRREDRDYRERERDGERRMNKERGHIIIKWQEKEINPTS